MRGGGTGLRCVQLTFRLPAGAFPHTASRQRPHVHPSCERSTQWLVSSKRVALGPGPFPSAARFGVPPERSGAMACLVERSGAMVSLIIRGLLRRGVR